MGLELILDVEEMAKEISKNTEIEYNLVIKVLDAEEDYLIKHGFTE